MPARKKTSGGVRTVTVGGAALTFELLYSRRKTLTLRVHPDRRLTVDAPNRTPIAQVNAFVLKHIQWALNKLALMEQTQTTPSHQFADGETFRYLGQEITLTVEADRIERVRLIGNTLFVGLHDPADRKRAGVLIERWYRRRAKSVFSELFAEACREMSPLGIRQPPLKIRLMRSRWGSCSSKGNITLNLKLIQVSETLLRYVILHELCHLIEFNHSPRFWALMDQVMPGWKAHRKALKTVDVWEMQLGS